ncbi:rhodanese-like domain-containing protein [Hymenobacter rubripertinctus]|uniref:Rhodanese-like domain-containing protein n=1 Tax=Hymenobacter rubripertinctus TaxID=2029981 RepID=A0A418R7A6_9BACT|nr:rhodanese-like domain-containing protein [Hymenobacter rubripertinctus]RIY13353.1 rhodanese-like domain-containing protein [Hymenobacter rubripertinctus]
MAASWLKSSRLRVRTLALLALVPASLAACGQQPERARSGAATPDMTAYDRMLGVLYKHTVPVVQPAELAAALQKKPQSVLLLDTRTPEEYQVSHLRDARFVDYDHYQQLDLSAIARTRPVVVYCTVGARSEQVGAWLRQQGFRDVRNLYGGIFQWMNDGQPVVNAQGPTTNVHPYSILWRPWLKTGNPVYK